MLGSIRKFSKSFVAKIFVAIIALPFLLWGMGDVFRSGKQNVLVEINEEMSKLLGGKTLMKEVSP